MDIPGKAGYPAPNGDHRGATFEESLRKEGSVPTAPQPQFAAFRSSQATDLAAGLGSMPPNFMPAMGDGMFNALGMAEGAAEMMRQYEEKMNRG